MREDLCGDIFWLDFRMAVRMHADFYEAISSEFAANPTARYSDGFTFVYCMGGEL